MKEFFIVLYGFNQSVTDPVYLLTNKNAKKSHLKLRLFISTESELLKLITCLRVVSLSLSPSCVIRDKPASKIRRISKMLAARPFLPSVDFRVTQDELSERKTTHSLLHHLYQS